MTTTSRTVWWHKPEESGLSRSAELAQIRDVVELATHGFGSGAFDGAECASMLLVARKAIPTPVPVGLDKVFSSLITALDASTIFLPESCDYSEEEVKKLLQGWVKVCKARGLF